VEKVVICVLKFIIERDYMAFCDYCPCKDCVNGQHGKYKLSHAQTLDGKWICDICYSYEVCLDGKKANNELVDGPCEDKNCKHRPKLATTWIK
jgi:hypothetical protein